MAERNELSRWGIEPGYFDVQGQPRPADPEAVRRVTEALAASTPTAAPASISAPPPSQPAFQGDGKRVWLLAVQLYALRSRRNWGHGDFTDLATLLELVGELGGA